MVQIIYSSERHPHDHDTKVGAFDAKQPTYAEG